MDKQLLEQALAFIASISPAFVCEATHHKKKEQHGIFEPCPHVEKQKQVYDAIRARLEQPEEKYTYGTPLLNAFTKPAPVQEPVAWMYEVNGAHTILDLFEPPDDAYDEGTLHPLYTTPPAAPVQERNFCERCGKRLNGGIHTCTPPKSEKNT